MFSNNPQAIGSVVPGFGGNAALNNFSATSDPTSNDDASDGYAVGSVWINTSTDTVFILVDSTPGSAIWTSPSRLEVNVQNGTSYVVTAADSGKLITCNNGSPITVSVNNGLPTGFSCLIAQLGAGQVTVGGTATKNNRQGHTKTAGQYAVVSLSYYASDSYLLAGDTAA